MSSRASDSDRNRPATTDELLAHADWVRTLSRALLADPNEADDVAQDAWVAALKRPPSAGDGLRAWWARVVHSAASNRRRSEGRRRDHEQLGAPRGDESAEIDTANTLDAQRRLVTAIETLDESLRRVIIGRYFHGLNSRQISELEHVPDSTVRTRLQKALERLRRELDDRAGGDRQAWAMVLGPLARLHDRALPAAAAAVAITGWIKLAAGVALLGLAGMAAYSVLAPQPTPGALASLEPSTAAARASDSLSGSSPAELRSEPVVAGSGTAVEAEVEEQVASVEARVLDGHGIPIRGALLQYVDRSKYGQRADADPPRAESDASGRVVLSIRDADRPRGRGKRAGLDQSTWDAEFEISCRGHATAERTATLALGQPSSLGDVLLEDGADLSGRCIDSDGRPMPGVWVRLSNPDLSLAERDQALRGSYWRADSLRSAKCSADGSFSMRGVPTGFFRVHASKESHTPAISEPFQLSTGEQHVVPELVLAENSVAIHGTVLDVDGTPCADAEVEYTMESKKFWAGTRGKKDGCFVIEGVSAAELDLCARNSRGDSGEALLLGVRAGETGVVLQLPPARRFDVYVVDPSGMPVERYSLGAYREDSTGRAGSVVAPGGRQSLVAGARPFFVRVAVDGYPMLEQGPFTQDSVPALVRFRLPQSATVRGRVLRAGVPEKWAEVHLDAILEGARVRADGAPVLVGPGSLAVTADDGAFSVGTARGGRYELWIEGQAGGVAFARTLELDLHRPIEDLVVDLDAVGSVAGRVEFAPDRRARATQVMYSCGLSEPRFERIAPDGTFHVRGLAPGTWWLRLMPDTTSCENLLPAGTVVQDPLLRQVEVRARETTDCDFDARGRELHYIEGRMLLDHRAAIGWTAMLAPEVRDWDAHRWTSRVSASGAFHLQAASFGMQILSVRSPGRADRDDLVEARLTVPAEGLTWSFDCELGALDIEGAPGAQCLVLAALPNGTTWTTHAILDAKGRAALDSLPAAKVRVSVAGSSSSPIEVEIPAHGRTQVRLP